MENLLCKYNNPSSHAGMKRMETELDMCREKILSLWILNVCSGLILKVFKDDNQNGCLSMKGGSGFHKL
jgi:hypothetical protein